MISNMKTLKILVVSQSEIEYTRSQEFLRASEIMAFYGGIIVDVSFKTISDFLKDAKTEHNGTDLDEDWIQGKLNDLNYHIVHVDMTPEEWNQLGLRSGLYGQSQVVGTKLGKQAIQYGRWNDNIGSRGLRYLHPDLKKLGLTSLMMGFWHETDHSCRGLTGSPTQLTHFYFYGLDLDGLPPTRENIDKAKRYALPSIPHMGWQLIDFNQLPTLENLNLRQQANLLQQAVNLFNLFFKKQSEYTEYPINAFAFHNGITQRYGALDPAYKSGQHNGTDWGVPVGTQCFAIAAGKVIKTQDNHATMGNAIYLEFYLGGQKYTARYMHLDRVLVKAGDQVRVGELIALTGDTGWSTGAHLHLEIFIGSVNIAALYNYDSARKVLVDPYQFIEDHASEDYVRSEKNLL